LLSSRPMIVAPSRSVRFHSVKTTINIVRIILPMSKYSEKPSPCPWPVLDCGLW